MSKLTKNTFLPAGTDWNEEEIKTAAEVFNRRRETFERMSHSKQDNVFVAVEANYIKDKHGFNSALYRDFIAVASEKNAGWSNSNFREHTLSAARGYVLLSGDDNDKKWIWKQNPSMSALAAVENIHPHMIHGLTQALKSGEKFPTRDSISHYGEKQKLLQTAEEKEAWLRLKAEQKVQQRLQEQQDTLESPEETVAEDVSEPTAQTIDVVSSVIPDSPDEAVEISTEIEETLVLSQPIQDEEPSVETEPVLAKELYNFAQSFMMTNYRELTEADMVYLRLTQQIIANYSKGRVKA